MSVDLERCHACQGRGYHHCDCWPADCICGWGDEDCEECRGEGWVEPYDEWEEWPDDTEPSDRTAQKGE